MLYLSAFTMNGVESDTNNNTFYYLGHLYLSILIETQKVLQ